LSLSRKTSYLLERGSSRQLSISTTSKSYSKFDAVALSISALLFHLLRSIVSYVTKKMEQNPRKYPLNILRNKFQTAVSISTISKSSSKFDAVALGQ